MELLPLARMGQSYTRIPLSQRAAIDIDNSVAFMTWSGRIRANLPRPLREIVRSVFGLPVSRRVLRSLGRRWIRGDCLLAVPLTRDREPDSGAAALRYTGAPCPGERPDTGSEVRAWPQPLRSPVMALLAEPAGGDALERVDRLRDGDLGREIHQRVHVVGLAVALDQLGLENAESNIRREGKPLVAAGQADT